MPLAAQADVVQRVTEPGVTIRVRTAVHAGVRLAQADPPGAMFVRQATDTYVEIRMTDPDVAMRVREATHAVATPLDTVPPHGTIIVGIAERCAEPLALSASALHAAGAGMLQVTGLPRQGLGPHAASHHDDEEKQGL